MELEENAIEGTVIAPEDEFVSQQYSWDYENAVESRFEEVASVEWDWESYQFNMTNVYREKTTGELFYATDSGCSCPSPFEDTKVSELHPIRRMQDWYDHVASYSQRDEWQGELPPQAVDSAESARRIIEEMIG